MAWLRRFAHGLRALTRRRVVDAEIDDEVRDYFERARAELEREGLSKRDAARTARLRLGDAGRAREALRSFGWERAVDSFFRDLHHSLRRIVRAPGSATVVVLTLALGIGACTAIYSAVFPILFAPLPYPQAERLVLLTDRDPQGRSLDVAFGTYEEIAARGRSFERLAVADRWAPALAGDGEPERLYGQLVTADYFRVLGVAPAVGRGFTAADDEPRAAHVAIVSDGLAQRRFGDAHAILGRPLRLDGTEHTVIGVMPDDFEDVVAPAAEVWVPRRYRRSAPFQGPEWGHHMLMLGRLGDGVSVDAAGRELATLSGTPVESFPRPRWAAFDNGLLVEPLRDAVTRDVRPALLAILGAVLVLLVMACANATSLLLARGARRRNEIAVRATLGAGRGRLVRALLTESLLLATLGGVAGLGVAALGIDAIVTLAPAGLPRLDAVVLAAPAFLATLFITLVVGLAVGLVPALRGAGADLGVDLALQPRTTFGGHHRLRRALVVVEVALALVILTGAGLLLRSVERLLAIEPGFEAAQVLSLQIVTTGQRYESDQEALGYYQAVLDAVRALPGVEEAALTSQLPLSGELDAYGAAREGAAPPTADGVPALRYTVSPGWFETMGIPLRRGRLLDARDRPGAPPVAVLSESLAERWFGRRDPIGQRVRFGPEIGRPELPARTVVGVVGDVKQASLALAAPAAFHVPLGQWVWVDEVQSLVVRASGKPEELAAAVREAIWSVDPSPPIVRVAAMQALVAASEGRRRFVLHVFAVFGLSALLLAAVGLYGVIAGAVAERRREIGLRAALGATRAGILGQVMRQGLALTALGVAIGLAAAVTATRSLSSLLYGVTALDPATYVGVVALLAVVSVLACSLPAWRAARVDPTIALRGD